MNDIDGIGEDARRRIAQSQSYPGKGQAWCDFLHHRARVIDWMHAGGVTGQPRDDHQIAMALSMDAVQVNLIRTRDRSLDNG
jgi:hypothetical protein